VLRSGPASLELPVPPQVPRAPAKLRLADATLLLARASLGRRGCLRLLARERPPDEEPANPRRFRRTEAARCYARA